MNKEQYQRLYGSRRRSLREEHDNTWEKAERYRDALEWIAFYPFAVPSDIKRVAKEALRYSRG